MLKLDAGRPVNGSGREPDPTPIGLKTLRGAAHHEEGSGLLNQVSLSTLMGWI